MINPRDRNTLNRILEENGVKAVIEAIAEWDENSDAPSREFMAETKRDMAYEERN